MPGFLGEISQKGLLKGFSKEETKTLLVESIQESRYYIERRTIKKFEQDKVFHEDDGYIILTEGVILNSSFLIEKYKSNSLTEAIKKMYNLNGETFFDEFRGSFSGLLYDKRKDKWIIYTNHFGDKTIFYLLLEDRVVFASEMRWLIDYMKNNNITPIPDKAGAYFLLTYGYMLEDYTLVKQIKRLIAGTYMVIEGGDPKIKRYFEVDNTPNNSQSEEEIIENMDSLFKKAVKLEFEKDREYGYKHIASLSGGLDSRMTVWVAHELGYVVQTNLTFSQTDYLDEKIAKLIASDLKHEWIFYALDNGLYLKNVYEMFEINWGIVLYSGAAHVNAAINKINFEKYGLYHTGQLGDVVIGTFYNSQNPKTPYYPGAGAYSVKLIRENEEKLLKYKYKNEEIFKFCGRGFNGVLSGNLPVQRFTEVSSPFMDVDFFKYCLKVPLKYRYNHEIYIKWITKKHPEAAKYIWEKWQAKITDPTIKILGRKRPIRYLLKKVFIEVFRKNSSNTKWNMNPFDYWYMNNPELRRFIDSFFEENIAVVNDKEIAQMCKLLFTNGNTSEKTQVLTLLASWRSLF